MPPILDNRAICAPILGLFRRGVVLLTAASLASSGIAQTGIQNLPDLGEAAQGAFSPRNERRIGESIMREIRRDPAYLDDPESTAYIESLGRRLVAVSVESRGDFEFFLVSDPTINAFALPGGFVGVHTGLILASQAESELAGVMAHEVAHVTQRHIARIIDKQSQLTLPLIAGLIIAMLAARSNSQISQAAIATTQAGAIQASLNYTRDFEREADRVGFQLLEQAGYDVNGMPAFFERLNRARRLTEVNAPAYLRTHPLDLERMADLQGRATSTRYRQSPDSLDYLLVRAKLRAMQGSSRDAINVFELQLKEKRFASESAARYGLALAHTRSREWRRAGEELALARKGGPSHWMFDTLEASIKVGLGQGVAARETLERSRKEFGALHPLTVAYLDLLQSLGQHKEALPIAEELVRARPRDARTQAMLAKAYASMGRRALQHRAQSEVYYLGGSVPAAIEQLQLARGAPDADFYLQSAADSRIRELRAIAEEEKKNPIR